MAIREGCARKCAGRADLRLALLGEKLGDGEVAVLGEQLLVEDGHVIALPHGCELGSRAGRHLRVRGEKRSCGGDASDNWWGRQQHRR